MDGFEVAYHLPEQVYTNADFFKDFPEEKRTNYARLGIQQRHVAKSGEIASDLAQAAAEELMAQNNRIAKDTGFLVFCAQEFDHYTPATACILQSRLKLPNDLGAVDFNHGCAGYPYGLFMASSFLKSSNARGALVLTGYTLTKVLHEGDKSSRFVFGDAGTATYITSSFAKKIGKCVFRTYGEIHDAIILQDGHGGRFPATEESAMPETDQFGNVTSRDKFKMNGMRVFSFALRYVPLVVKETLYENELRKEDIDLFVFHQANGFMLETLREKLGIREDRFVLDMKTTGNTGQSSIPIALAHLMKAGRISKGTTVMLTGFGTGLGLASTVVRF